MVASTRTGVLVLVLLAPLILGAAVTAQPAGSSTSQAVPAAMRADPEYLFDMAQPGRVARVVISGGTTLDASPMNALLDDNSDTATMLRLPDGGASKTEQPILQVMLKEPKSIVEVSLRLNPAASKGNPLPCLSRSSWVATPGTTTSNEDAVSALNTNKPGTVLRTLANRAVDAEVVPTSARITWLLPRGDSAAESSTLSLVLPGACNTSGLAAAVTAINMYTKPNLLDPFNSTAKILDDHFHPCAFSNQCSDVDTVVAEQKRQGVFASFIFGLQHNLLKRASPWITAVFGKDSQDPQHGLLDETPYHYDDLGAQPSYKPTAKPGITEVNVARAAKGLGNITGYDGWPMASTTLADWHTLTQFYKAASTAGSGIKGHAYPFLSSMRIDTPPGYTLYTVCTKANTSDWTINEMLIRSMDTIFPSSVFGYQEYNLNKTIVAQNKVYAPVLDATFKGCMKGVLSYMALTRRPFGVHYDLTPWQPGEPPFITFAKEFQKTIMIWDHGGIAPEVDKRLAATDHLRLLQAFLDTSPGKRYIDFSWNTGFWLRFAPKALGNIEMNSATMKEQPRNWAEDCKAYMTFIQANQDFIMFGSDQVSLDYPDSLSRDLRGGAIFNRPGYFQAAATYGASLRQEVGLLYNCMNAAIDAGGPSYRLKPEVVSKVFWGNGKKLIDSVKMPSPGVSACDSKASTSRKEGPVDPNGPNGCIATGVDRDQALKFVRSVFELQWRELREGAGTDAPGLQEFLPPSLRDSKQQMNGHRRHLMRLAASS